MPTTIVSFLEDAGQPVDLTLALSGDIAGSVFDPAVTGPVDLEISLGGDLDGTVKSTFVEAPIALGLSLRGDLAGGRQRQTSINLRLSLSGDLAGGTRLELSEPAPVLTNLSPFKKGSVPRLFANGAEIGITSFNFEARRNEIGTNLNVGLTNQGLANASTAKKYDFQLNVKDKPSDPDDFQTLISNADLDSRNVGIRFRGDSLSMSVVSPTEDALRRYPESNSTIYNPDKTDFDTSQIEPLPDENGDFLPYYGGRRRGLTLYWLLNYVRKQTGVSAITTNIPNYEITRADFSLTQSYTESLKPFFGAYDALWLADGGAVKIIDKSQIVPGDFDFFEIAVDKFLSWQVNIPSLAKRDGFILSYNDSDIEADSFIDVTETLPAQDDGIFGSNNFSRIVTERTTRKWFNHARPGIYVRSEIIKELTTTSAPIPPFTATLTVIGRDTSEHTFDRTGKRLKSIRRIERRIKNFEGDGTIILTQVSDEIQNIAYVTHPERPRSFIQSRISTMRNALISVDANNPYFNPVDGSEAPFRQEFSLADGAGNLADGITTEYGPVKKVIQNFTYLGNNQFQTTTQTIDYLRGTPTPGVSEPLAGDASIGGTSGRTARLVVYRDGFTADSAGYGYEEFSVGELPLQFAFPLAKRKLAERFTRKQSGTLEVGGYSPNLKRGALLSVKDRAGNSYGNFIVEGFNVAGENTGKGWQITTQLQVAEI